jgi:hypothetical protein
MADDLTNRGAQDRARINVNEEHEMRYWREKFGVTADQLKAAVKAVGVEAKAVEQHLRSAKV